MVVRFSNNLKNCKCPSVAFVLLFRSRRQHFLFSPSFFPHHTVPMKSAGMGCATQLRAAGHEPATSSSAKAVFIAPSSTGATVSLGTTSASSRTAVQVMRDDIFNRNASRVFIKYLDTSKQS